MCFIAIQVVSSSAVELKKHEWRIGTEISYIKYEEPDVMGEEGAMYGLVSSYTYRGWVSSTRPKVKRPMIRFEGKYSYGQVEYTSNDTGSMDGIDDFMIEGRGLLGYDFISDKTTITPYIGMGYRYLYDDSSGKTTTTGARGYQRESNYYYSPVGLEVLTDLKNGWSLGVMLEYDIFWDGEQKSYLSDANLGFSDLTNDQNDGYGLRSYIRLRKESSKWDLSIEPFIKYWNIDKSEKTNLTYAGVIWGYGWEPENSSTEAGAKVEIKF